MSPETGASRSLRILVLVSRPSQEPNPVAQRSVEQNRDPVGQREHHRHHDGGLGDESKPG